MYEITVHGRAERTLRIALQDLVDAWCPDGPGSTLTMRVVDQSALLAVLGALHDLGVSIESVHRVR